MLDAELVALDPHEHDVLGDVSLDAIVVIPYTVVPEEDLLRSRGMVTIRSSSVISAAAR